MDYESRSSYSFSVEVLNPIVDPRFLRRGPFKDRASIRVAVLDADEPPRFSRARYHMDVSENCPPACTVGRVSAVDPDTGLTNNIRYKQAGSRCSYLEVCASTWLIHQLRLEMVEGSLGWNSPRKARPNYQQWRR